jgi:hypothetical protein
MSSALRPSAAPAPSPHRDLLAVLVNVILLFWLVTLVVGAVPDHCDPST